MKREIKSLRKRLWESMTGCDCPPTVRANQRCTVDAVRCNGRIEQIHKNYALYGLLFGSGSTLGDGLDPKASKEAVDRREALLAQEKRPNR